MVSGISELYKKQKTLKLNKNILPELQPSLWEYTCYLVWSSGFLLCHV